MRTCRVWGYIGIFYGAFSGLAARIREQDRYDPLLSSFKLRSIATFASSW